MGYVEETGFGMKTIKSLNSEYGLPMPEYSFTDPFLSLTFPRTMESVKRVTNNLSISELSQEEIRGFEWVKSVGEISAREYAAKFSYTQKTASRHLSKMLKLDLIKTNSESIKSPNILYMPKV